MKEKFNEGDPHKTGIITLYHFKNVIRGTKFITPKEKNLLIRLQKNDEIKITDFNEMLFNVRFEIFISEMMETNINDLEAHILKEFLAEDLEKTGQITIK